MVRHTPAHIGRTAGSVRLDDSRVSRLHAALRYDDQQWVVEDLASRHGTSLNGERIEAPAALTIGDILRIGRIELAVEQIRGEVESGDEAADVSGGPRLRLYARWPNRKGRMIRRLLSAHGEEVIGSRGNALAIDARRVEPEHVRLWPDDHTWRVEAMSEAAPVSLNGRELAGPAALTEGDRLQVGRANLLVLEASGASVPPPSAARRPRRNKASEPPAPLDFGPAPSPPGTRSEADRGQQTDEGVHEAGFIAETGEVTETPPPDPSPKPAAQRPAPSSPPARSAGWRTEDDPIVKHIGLIFPHVNVEGDEPRSPGQKVRSQSWFRSFLDRMRPRK